MAEIIKTVAKGWGHNTVYTSFPTKSPIEELIKDHVEAAQ
jgi:hypothetical protein